MCCLDGCTRQRRILRDGDAFFVEGKCGFTLCFKTSQIPSTIDVLPLHDNIVDAWADGMTAIVVTEVYVKPSENAKVTTTARIVGSVSVHHDTVLCDLSYQDYVARHVPFTVNFPKDVYRSDLIHEAICEVARSRAKVGAGSRHAPCIHSVANEGASSKGVARSCV